MHDFPMAEAYSRSGSIEKAIEMYGNVAGSQIEVDRTNPVRKIWLPDLKKIIEWLICVGVIVGMHGYVTGRLRYLPCTLYRLV